MTEPGTDDLRDGVRSGDRRALARAITLVESTRPDHRAQASELLDALLPHTGGSMRLGLSGTPGAGKSTLIEALGVHAIEQGRRVAVLAVDPSSTRSGGSILGDKTRMTELGRQVESFIRPTPAAGTLGGVARRTREALLVCEAAGFDVVIVETVGVGQSEVAVADLVDLFLLVLSPAAGDELQGIKRGITELADLIVVNKADGELLAPAQRSAADLAHAVHLLRPKRPGWEVPVCTTSALTGVGVPELWATITASHAALVADDLDGIRARQGVAWMWNEVTEDLMGRLREHPGVQQRMATAEAEVAAGTLAPAAAARQLLAAFLGEDG